ncbi:hypothetical protein [Nonomuraea diastatica]|nr:hypothetical protein [Nonomuraea diastatica]
MTARIKVTGRPLEYLTQDMAITLDTAIAAVEDLPPSNGRADNT